MTALAVVAAARIPSEGYVPEVYASAAEFVTHLTRLHKARRSV